MKRFLMVGGLVGLLAVSAFAGDSSTSGSPAPAPTGTPGTTNTTPGDVPTVGKAEELSSDALSALLSALSFLGI
ncbi:MAG: hypothetical protein ACRD9S_05775 [Pyrinomonadaceae bacterium]